MPHPVDVLVGKRVRLRRTMLGLSMDEVGKTVGVSFQQMQKYERGTNRLSCSRLVKIAEVLNTPVGYFFEKPGKGDLQAAQSDEEKLSSRETLEMARAYYRIPDTAIRKPMFELMKAIGNELEKYIRTSLKKG